MASSSFCELSLRQHGVDVARARTGVGFEVTRVVGDREVDGTALQVQVRRGGDASGALRVRLGDTLVLATPSGGTEAQADCEALAGEFGEAVFICEEIDDDDAEEPIVLIELAILVRAPQRVLELHAAVLGEIERIHEALALDVLSQTTHRRGIAARSRAIHPDEEVGRLDDLARTLEAALDQIGTQPSTAMVHDVSTRRWRPGHRLRPSAVTRIALDAETRIAEGRVVALGRAVVETQRLTTDIAEHRQIRAGIARLTERCAALQAWCERAAAAYGREQSRWSNDRSGGSIYQREFAPRVERLGTLAGQASHVRRRLTRLVQTYDFVSEAGPVRGKLNPTPVFLGRPGYREAYQVLRRIDDGSLVSPIGEEVRVRFKALSRLYEYWCFMRIVRALGELIGPPILPRSFRVIDDIYRPDLEPAQTFEFSGPAGSKVFATYEPDLIPARSGHRRDAPSEEEVAGWGRQRDPSARRPSRGWVASLSTAPLRPDVLIEVCIPGMPAVGLVLDAKSGWDFPREKLWQQTDYRARVIDPVDGRQPIRQVFFLHPNPQLRPLESLPGYLNGRCGDLDNSIIGAAPFSPAAPERGLGILMRFLSVAGMTVVETSGGDRRKDGPASVELPESIPG